MNDYQPGHDILAKKRTVDVLTKENVSFKDLFLSSRVLSGLQKSRFDRPSPIQLKAIPYGRCGLDLIVQAKSGTGKTCVFTVIALEAISVDAPTLQVIILAPTREIAIQIEDVIKAVGRDIKGLKIGAFIGGRPVYEDKSNAKGCHIAVGSPGRIFQLIELEILKCQNVRIFVLDEADKLLEENFQSQINSIYSMLPANKQMIAASATYPNELVDFVTRYMRDPTFVRLNPKDMALLGVNQYYFLIGDPPDKFHSVFECKIKAVVELLETHPFQQALIFSNYHSHAKDLSDACNSVGLPATYISGNLEQERRLEAMKMLKDFKCKVLISTDLTSRGIDASNVDLVLNLDVPLDWETYMHRTGRAGRFGSLGAVISVVTSGAESDQLFGIAKICGIKLLPMTCKSGKVEFGPNPVDLSRLSPDLIQKDNEVALNQNRNLQCLVITEDVARKNLPQKVTEGTEQDCLSERSLEIESMAQIPKIPSLPELMSKTSNKPQFSYAYDELMENWNVFKEHGIFKELRRIKKENRTTAENTTLGNGSSGKNLTGKTGNDHSVKDSSAIEISRAKQNLQERSNVGTKLDLRAQDYRAGGDQAIDKVKASKKSFAITEHKPSNRPHESGTNGMHHHTALKEPENSDTTEKKIEYRNKDFEVCGDQVTAKPEVRPNRYTTNENVLRESSRHHKSRAVKLLKDEGKPKTQVVYEQRYPHDKEISYGQHKRDKHRSKTKCHDENQVERDGDRKLHKSKINKHKNKGSHHDDSRKEGSSMSGYPTFLLPRYSDEAESQHFNWMGMPDFIHLQKQCQMAWQNYYHYYWWTQWYSMVNFQRSHWP